MTFELNWSSGKIIILCIAEGWHCWKTGLRWRCWRMAGRLLRDTLWWDAKPIRFGEVGTDGGPMVDRWWMVDRSQL